MIFSPRYEEKPKVEENLSDSLIQMEHEIKEMRGAMKENSVNKEQLMKIIRDKEQQIEELRKNLEVLQSRIKEVLNQNFCLQDELDGKAEELRSLTEQLRNDEQEIEYLREQLGRMNGQVMESPENVNNEKAKLFKTVDRFQEGSIVHQKKSDLTKTQRMSKYNRDQEIPGEVSDSYDEETEGRAKGGEREDVLQCSQLSRTSMSSSEDYSGMSFEELKRKYRIM